MATMIDFDEARRRAEAAVRPKWSEQQGTLFAAMEGWEDRRAYGVNVGAEEWLIDGDPGYLTADAPFVFVDKRSGKVKVTTYLVDAARIDKMSPVSTA